MLVSSLRLALRASRSGPACGCPNTLPTNLSNRRLHTSRVHLLPLGRRSGNGRAEYRTGPAQTSRFAAAGRSALAARS
jgi:hypothetical protein